MMRLLFIFVLVSLVGLFIQGTMVRPVSPSAVAPDFLLVLVIYLALHFPGVWGLVGAYSLGLAQDFASGEYVGPSAAGMVVAFYFAVVVSKKVYAENAIAVGLLVMIASVMKSLTYALVFEIFLGINVLITNEVKLWSLSIPVMFVEALFSGLIAPMVMRILHVTRKQVTVR